MKIDKVVYDSNWVDASSVELEGTLICAGDNTFTMDMTSSGTETKSSGTWIDSSGTYTFIANKEDASGLVTATLSSDSKTAYMNFPSGETGTMAVQLTKD